MYPGSEADNLGISLHTIKSIDLSTVLIFPTIGVSRQPFDIVKYWPISPTDKGEKNISKLMLTLILLNNLSLPHPISDCQPIR